MLISFHYDQAYQINLHFSLSIISLESLFLLLQLKTDGKGILQSCNSGRLSVHLVCRTLLIFWNIFMSQLLCEMWRASVSDGRKQRPVGVECQSHPDVGGSAWLELGCPDSACGSLQEATVPPAARHKWPLMLLSRFTSQAPDSMEELQDGKVLIHASDFFHKWEIWLSTRP